MIEDCLTTHKLNGFHPQQAYSLQFFPISLSSDGQILFPNFKISSGLDHLLQLLKQKIPLSHVNGPLYTTALPAQLC